MEFRYQSVPLDSIHCEDIRFRITEQAVSALLCQSIRQLGIINPPVLLENDSGFRVVCGFNRLDACRQLKKAEIHCRILAADTPTDRCIFIAIADNACQRSLSLIEQARAIALLASCTFEVGDLIDKANTLGLAVNREMVGKLLQVHEMNDLLKTGIARGSIALPVALQLQSIQDTSFLNELGTLLIELDLSLNRQRELLDWVISICRRDNSDPSQLLSVGSIQSIRENQTIDRKEKGRQIRDTLRKIRFPAIVGHEQHFAETVARLRLNNGTHLIAPQHFESPIFSLKFDFRNRQELSNKLYEFDRLNKSDLIDSLWESRPAE